jgi:hypothetical protein
LSLSDSVVFIASAGSALEARAASTGAVAWRHANASWQTITATATLVLGVSGDHAYALDAASGRTRWVTETTGPNTRLAIEGRHLLMLSDNDLLLREVDTGTPLWRAALTAAPAAPPAFGTDFVAVAQQDGVITAFDRASGAPRWQTTLTSPVRALTAASPIVYAGLASGAFCALNDRNGSERWCAPLRVPLAGPAVIDGDFVRVALLDNSLRGLHRLNGAMLQPGSLGHRPASGPWLTATSLIVALTTGEFVVMDRTSGRTLMRLQVPGAGGSYLMERAAISPDGGLVASLTIATGGERRLSLYQPRLTATLPIRAGLPAFPGRQVRLPPPPITPATPLARPRPFPAPR